jgi:tetratricopeptide (TPR) repeat protein
MIFCIGISFSFSAAALAIDTSSGPASQADAPVLMEQARQAYEHGMYSDAIAPLERLLNRYPGYPDATTYRILRAWLGHSFLAIKMPEKAITPLETYIEGAGASDQMRGQTHIKLWARIWIIESYLQLEKYREALIASDELKNDPDHTITPELEARSLLLKARTLIALDREPEAAPLVNAALGPATLCGEPKALGEARLLGLELKIHDCSRLASARTLEEAEAIDQLERRGTCLAEAVVLFEKLADSKSEDHADLGRVTLGLAYKNYIHSCQNPPAPQGKSRTSAQQKRTYLVELAAKVVPACRAQAGTASLLLQKWKKDKRLSPSMETTVNSLILNTQTQAQETQL